VGRNSKAKRDAKVKSRGKQQRADRHDSGHLQGALLGSPFDGDMTPSGGVPGSLFRSSCSECGSPNLQWMTTADLRDQVSAELKARVQEGIDFVGPRSQAWLCDDCGNFGIMG
jgi:hypothetical protein